MSCIVRLDDGTHYGLFSDFAGAHVALCMMGWRRAATSVSPIFLFLDDEGKVRTATLEQHTDYRPLEELPQSAQPRRDGASK